MLGRTVEELLDSISYEELERWQEFWRIHPFGPWVEDYRFAQLCALTVNANIDPSKHRPFTTDDFMIATQLDASRKKRDAGNLDPGMFNALMQLAAVAEAKEQLRQSLPHLSPERLAQISERISPHGL